MIIDWHSKTSGIIIIGKYLDHHHLVFFQSQVLAVFFSFNSKSSVYDPRSQKTKVLACLEKPLCQKMSFI